MPQRIEAIDGDHNSILSTKRSREVYKKTANDLMVEGGQQHRAMPSGEEKPPLEAEARMWVPWDHSMDHKIFSIPL